MYINFFKRINCKKISLIHKNSHICNIHTLLPLPMELFNCVLPLVVLIRIRIRIRNSLLR